MAMPGYTKEDFDRDAKAYGTADQYTRLRLEKKWGSRACYFPGYQPDESGAW